MVKRGSGKYRILVVDDDETIARMVKQMVERMGYLSVACHKPLDALKLFSKVPERFDAVILDEMMPEMRGTQLAGEMLKVKDDLAIILMTGKGHMITLEEVRASGVRATLIKPLLKDRLKLALSQILPSKEFT